MRVLLLLLPLLLIGALAGCGDGGEGALRIEVEVFSFDGDLPEGLRLRRIDAGAEEQALYDLVPVPGGRRGEYEAPGAPDGPYVVEGPTGWWMLSAGSAPPMLVRGLQPTLVGLGRGRTLYLGAHAAEVRPSVVWGAVRIAADGGEEPVPTTVEADERGYVVALRFAPEDWRGTLQVVGRIALGPPPTPAPGPDAPLADPIRFEAPADGGPVVTRIQQSTVGSLQVILVPASADVTTDGLRLGASLDGLPIPSRVEATGYGGFALFEHLPLVDRMLSLQVGDEPLLHRVAPEVRRLQANLRVLVAGDAPTRRVRVAVEAPADATVVQVRPAGAVAFGRVPFEVEDLGVVFSAPTGDIEILLRAGPRWARLRAAGDEAVDVAVGTLVEGVVVGGTVDGARPGTVVRFFREVAEGTEAVLGDGFEVRVEPSGTFEARLPSGRYLVEVATRTGSWRRPATLVAESPGARLHLALESP